MSQKSVTGPLEIVKQVALNNVMTIPITVYVYQLPYISLISVYQLYYIAKNQPYLTQLS